MLQTHLNRFVSFVHNDEQCLACSRVLIVEDSDIVHQQVEGKYISFVPRHALATPEQYSRRFEEHMNAGFSWININAAGIWDDTLLVIIELPNYASVTVRNKASVNFSGPHTIGGQPKWEVADWLRVID